MKGLLIKDWMLMKKRGMIFLIILLVYFFIGLLETDTMIFGFMIIILSPMLVTSAFSYDEAVKWNTMAVTLPVRRKTQVKGRYFMALIAIAVAMAFCLVQNIFIYFRDRDAELLKSNLIILLIFCSIALMYIAATFLLVYWFGAEKGRYVIVFGAALIGAFLGASGALRGLLVENWKSNLVIGSVILLCIAIVIFIGCYFAAVRIYEKKDF